MNNEEKKKVEQQEVILRLSHYSHKIKVTYAIQLLQMLEESLKVLLFADRVD